MECTRVGWVTCRCVLSSCCVVDWIAVRLSIRVGVRSADPVSVWFLLRLAGLFSCQVRWGDHFPFGLWVRLSVCTSGCPDVGHCGRAASWLRSGGSPCHCCLAICPYTWYGRSAVSWLSRRNCLPLSTYVYRQSRGSHNPGSIVTPSGRSVCSHVAASWQYFGKFTEWLQRVLCLCPRRVLALS